MPVLPSKLAGEVGGVAAMIVDGMLVPILLVFSRGLQGAGWPYYRINGIVFGVIGAIIFTWRAVGGTLSKSCFVWKWVLFRGFFGALTYVLQSIAAPRAPIGDVVALGTMNVVVAAMVGQIFLSEKLGPLQVLACFFSVLGAALITRPSFIFGGMGINGTILLGYVFATAAGFSNAGNTISSRRCPDAPITELSASAFVSCAVTLCLYPCVPGMTDDGSWALVFASPLLALAFSCGLGLTAITSSFMFTTGSKWLPAAVSATVNNASVLIFGYLSQWVFFDMAPDLIAVVGALFMFISVVLVAATKVPPAEVISKSLSQFSLMGRSQSSLGRERSSTPRAAASAAAAHAAGAELSEDQATPDTSEPATLEIDRADSGASTSVERNGPVAPCVQAQLSKDIDDDEQSLASFIAMEYATPSPKASSAVRRRAAAAGASAENPTTPVASVFGMFSAVAPAAV